MYYQTSTKRIFVRLLPDKNSEPKYLEIDAEIDHKGDIALSTLLIDFANRELIPIKAQVFYLDSLQKIYIFIGDYINNKIKVPPARLLVNNWLSLLYKQPTISDEALANPLKQKKRSKERTIREAIQYCKEWRKLYREGRINSKGEIEKVTLDQAALLLGISRKTVEDYYTQLKNGMKYQFDFLKNKDQKMGVLRTFLRQAKKKPAKLITLNKQEEQQLTFEYIENCMKEKQKQETMSYYYQDFSQYSIWKMKNQDSSSSSDENYLLLEYEE